MDFLKKNYEKLLLGIVLLGLIAALGFLPFFIASQKQSLQDKKDSIRPVNVQQLSNLDLTVSETAVKRAAAPAMIDFGPPNRLFNSMPWQKAADGHLIRADRVGPTALLVTNVREGSPTYIIGVEKPAASGVAKSRSQFSCTPTSKNKVFSVLEVKGKPEDPTELVLQLEDSKERAVVSKTKPFERIEGYMADLRYDPEKKKWDNCRAKARLSQPLSFNGEEYSIEAVTKDEVVLSAKSNGKKWTVKANPST
jgi:hypothetical protein